MHFARSHVWWREGVSLSRRLLLGGSFLHDCFARTHLGDLVDAEGSGDGLLHERGGCHGVGELCSGGRSGAWAKEHERN